MSNRAVDRIADAIEAVVDLGIIVAALYVGAIWADYLCGKV
jgi:hypothetical protein